MRMHLDNRRVAYCDLFDGMPGDVNLFVIEPGQRTCWHRHQTQNDQFRVLQGRVRFGKMRKYYEATYEVLDRPEQLLKIPYGWWHGYENLGTEPAWVLMYLDQKYSAADEERMGEDVMPWYPYAAA